MTCDYYVHRKVRGCIQKSTIYVCAFNNGNKTGRMMDMDWVVNIYNTTNRIKWLNLIEVALMVPKSKM